ncbi:MAG: c-type cytochrome [Gammaproteobacteria bacterium]
MRVAVLLFFIISLTGCGSPKESAAPDGAPAVSSPDALVTDLSLAGLQAADYMAGKQAFQGRCSACHTLAQDSANIAGPNLWGVFDRQAGSMEEFTYSDTLRDADFLWSPERLDAWLSDPKGYLPGNIMGIPEAVPDADRPNILHFMLIETGAVDWERPEAAFADAQQDRSKPPAERFPSFWNHLMFNTANYRWVNAEAGEEFAFKAYFKADGSVVTSRRSMTGFWHITEKDFFCYAIRNMPVGVGQMVECFPVAAMAIPRFSEQLWTSRPQKGVELNGGILPGRPDWVEAGGRPPS